jgi:hypothetical protein
MMIGIFQLLLLLLLPSGSWNLNIIRKSVLCCCDR